MWLLACHLAAIPILTSPSFGFISYMNPRGILLFMVVAWGTTALAAFTLWPAIARRRLAVAYPIALAAAFLPVALAWGVALHTLYWRPGDGFFEFIRWVKAAVVLGGVYTTGYWLPTSVLSCFILRRRAN